jgi:2-C-methyl-D-erythritol 4-phosphate cytidylyltransferase/2-C-methyl-D-erythritol 2,4-cyclodiphosphate synthase
MDRLKRAIITYEAVVPAIRFRDTIARVEQDVITADDNRETVRKIQTPQVFVTEWIRQAHLQAKHNHTYYTDDQTLYRHEIRRDVHVVDGSEANIKVTTHLDMMILEAIL